MMQAFGVNAQVNGARTVRLGREQSRGGLTKQFLRTSEAIVLTWAQLDLGARPGVLVRKQYYGGERYRLKSGHARRNIPLWAGMADRLRARRRSLRRRGPSSAARTSPAGC
jgi:hypothetical protein